LVRFNAYLSAHDSQALLAGDLCHDWAPDAFVVSFKLETDERLLLTKAANALELYGVHAVVRKGKGMIPILETNALMPGRK
jgi:hypothetical protein